MPRKGRSNEEIVHALHQVDGGEKAIEDCRRLGVNDQTFYRWKKQFAGRRLHATGGQPRRRVLAFPADFCAAIQAWPRRRCFRRPS